MSRPMSGVTVVDVCSMTSGPWATDILGGQGADVSTVDVPVPHRRGGYAGTWGDGLDVERIRLAMMAREHGPLGAGHREWVPSTWIVDTASRTNGEHR